jgi:hypothetical protein
MAKFVFIYTGGQMGETPEAQEQAMQDWVAWFTALGSAVTDMGNPFGSSATASEDGVTEGSSSRASGYSIVEADSLSDATTLTKGCPILTHGGSVEVHEALSV